MSAVNRTSGTFLEEYVKGRRRLEILDWMGRVDYYDDYDHKNLRRAGAA